MSIQNNTLPDNPNIEVIKAKETGLFTNYIYKAIPLAFDESMSYYETLCGLLNYLQNTILPTLNNNADAVSELQNLYIELKTYVDDYFTDLNVQEEINNKLDKMTEDGTLTNLIKNYVDPIIQEYENDINNTINNQNRQINNMNNNINDSIDGFNNKLNSIVSGKPTPVSSISDMTDTTKSYLLTTDGYWYYYDGTDWVRGGLYQATEIENGSITPIKTNFFTYKDLFENITVENARLSSTGGGSSPNESFRLSDYIPVTRGQKIYLNGVFDRLRYYNVNKVSINSLIDDSNLSNTYKTIPSNADPVRYIRIDWDSRVNDIPNINLYDADYIEQLIPIKEIYNARNINGIEYDDLYSALNGAYDDLANSIQNDNKLYIKYTPQNQAVLHIYMKTKNNYYMGYEFKHMIDATVNSNIWRLKSVHAYEKDEFNNFTDISGELVHAGSEWECAIRETGKEFVGGSTHGNELLTDIVFFLDDVRYSNPQDLHNKTGNKLRIIRRSNLYRSDDNTVNIASHYVDYLFENNKITIDNRINWNVNTNLGISFMTMLGLKRTNDYGQVSSYGIKEGDGRLLNISQVDHTETQNTYKCRKAYAFNDSIVGAKTYTSVELLEDDYLPRSSFHFDNRENYNKFYFDHCGANYNVIAGDIWHTKSQYHIEYLGSIS